MMHRIRALVPALLAAALAVSIAGPAAAKSDQTFKDTERGFEVRTDAMFEQVPPKLTEDNQHEVMSFYADKAKYDRAFVRPQIDIYWFATPKLAVLTPRDGQSDDVDVKGKDRPALEKERRDLYEKSAKEDELSEEEKLVIKGRLREINKLLRPESLDDVVDPILRRAESMIGPYQALATREMDEKQAQRIKTAGKQTALVVEINEGKPRSKKDPEPGLYVMTARIELVRPFDVVEVGFLAMCPWKERKKLSKEFLEVVKSFKELGDATNTRNLAADPGDMSADQFRKWVQETKVIDGWKQRDTEHYVLLYDKDVDPKLVDKIATQIEAIREQIYLVLFPPDKAITAVSVVRICKDPEQYSAYGGPGGSAGYWSWPAMELVFYEDPNFKGNSLAVLYHEAFHQYIYYSVGDLAPHSWFNEGHGDYFAGHDYKSGRFKEEPFKWRKDLARSMKKSPRLPPLAEWLTWSQAEYYGRNTHKISPGANYALGWDFIYFLRTTRNEAYRQILPRYFASLKEQVTMLRDQERAAVKTKGETLDRERLRDLIDVRNDAFLDKALKDALAGIDVQRLEKDWLDNDP